jgi:signal transduction histidine kinase
MAEGVFVSMIAARLKSAKQHAEDNAAEARELERRILEITDAEQRRIGSDLHDGLGQHLTGIALMTRRLEQRLNAASSPEADDASKVSALAKTAVAWTHDLSRSLSPPVLESAGLAEALRELAAYAESLFGIECTFEQSGQTKPLDLDISVHLYRIAQEAISNAVRHGKAKQVKLLLSSSASNINVQVIDDGHGIDPSAHSTNGMGLRIMQYRARMIGADLKLGHGAGGGTIVECRFPLGQSHGI